MRKGTRRGHQPNATGAGKWLIDHLNAWHPGDPGFVPKSLFGALGDMIAGGLDNETMLMEGMEYATAARISPLGWFGDGSDGATVWDGSTTVLGVAPGASIYVLTRDIFVSSMVINSGVTVSTASFRVFCTGTVTINGTLRNIGVAALGATGGAATGSTGPLGAGSAGATGGLGVGGGGTAAAHIAGGAGAAGGASGTPNAGGSGGAVTTIPANRGGAQMFRHPVWSIIGSDIGNGAIGAAFNGGTGGGAGGGDGANNGGGGGGGGGPLTLGALAIVNNGTLSVAGGNGGNGAGGNAGGGGGGGGGVMWLITRFFSGTAATAAGGTHGNKAGTGTNGSDGSAGNVMTFIV